MPRLSLCLFGCFPCLGSLQPLDDIGGIVRPAGGKHTRQHHPGPAAGKGDAQRSIHVRPRHQAQGNGDKQRGELRHRRFVVLFRHHLNNRFDVLHDPFHRYRQHQHQYNTRHFRSASNLVMRPSWFSSF